MSGIESEHRDDVDVSMTEWGTTYLVCQERHRQLKKCVLDFNERAYKE